MADEIALEQLHEAKKQIKKLEGAPMSTPAETVAAVSHLTKVVDLTLQSLDAHLSGESGHDG